MEPRREILPLMAKASTLQPVAMSGALIDKLIVDLAGSIRCSGSPLNDNPNTSPNHETVIEF
jgi:hypothetical protein